jgi:S-adenosylmethionine/arginine decarboxylase-like enzyme
MNRNDQILDPKSDHGYFNDEQIVKKFRLEEHYGLSTGIDLEKCNFEKIKNTDVLRDFAIGICDYINVPRHIEPTITHVGNNPRLSGYSLVQLLESSSIIGHFKDFDGNAFIDIFSCKPYQPRAAATFCKKYFNAQRMNVRYIAFRD